MSEHDGEFGAVGADPEVVGAAMPVISRALQVYADEQAVIYEDAQFSRALRAVPTGSDNSVPYSQVRAWFNAAVEKEGFVNADEVRVCLFAFIDTFFTVQPSPQLRRLVTNPIVAGRPCTFMHILDPRLRVTIGIPPEVSLRMFLRSLSPVAGPRWIASDQMSRLNRAVPDWLDPVHIPTNDVIRRGRGSVPEQAAVVEEERPVQRVQLAQSAPSFTGGY